MDEMKVTKRCYVLGVGKPYDFIPEGGTEPVKGCKLAYVGTDDLSKPYIDEESGNLGHMPQKYTMEPSFYDTVKNVPFPSLADITFAIKLGTSGTKVRIADISFVQLKK